MSAAQPRKPLGTVQSNSRLSLGGPATRKPGPRPGSAVKPSLASQSTRRETIAAPPNPSTRGRQSLGARGRPSLGGRQSLSAMNRSTISYSVTGGTDPRPIKDKNYQRKCAQELIKFVVLKGYDRPIAPKVLESPTRRDVFSIIEFLFRHVDPTFSLDNSERVEEEIVQMFKLLRYPFSLSARSLVSVGTPHTWPSLLAALHWLMEVIDSGDKMKSNDKAQEEPHEFFFNYLEASYQEFFQGTDDSSALDQELASSFAEKSLALQQEIAALMEKKDAHEKELNKLRNRPNPLSAVQTLNNTLNSDVVKFSNLCDDLKTYVGKMAEKRDRELEKLKAAEETLAEVRAEVRRYHDEVQKQEIAAIDAERLMQEKSTLEESLNIVNKEKELIEATVWSKELEVSKKLEQVDIQAKRYTELATKLQIVPARAKNAEGIDFSINFSTHSAPAEDKLATQLRDHIKPKLRELIASFTKKIGQAQEGLLTVQQEVRDIQERLNDVKDEIMALEDKSKKGDAVYKKEKEKLQANISAIEVDIENVQRTENDIRARAQENLIKTEKMKEMLQGDYDQTLHVLSGEQEELCNSIYLSLDMIAKHKAYLRDQLSGLTEYLISEKTVAENANFS